MTIDDEDDDRSINQSTINRYFNRLKVDKPQRDMVKMRRPISKIKKK